VGSAPDDSPVEPVQRPTRRSIREAERRAAAAAASTPAPPPASQVQTLQMPASEPARNRRTVADSWPVAANLQGPHAHSPATGMPVVGRTGSPAAVSVEDLLRLAVQDSVAEHERTPRRPAGPTPGPSAAAPAPVVRPVAQSGASAPKPAAGPAAEAPRPLSRRELRRLEAERAAAAQAAAAPAPTQAPVPALAPVEPTPVAPPADRTAVEAPTVGPAVVETGVEPERPVTSSPAVAAAAPAPVASPAIPVTVVGPQPQPLAPVRAADEPDEEPVDTQRMWTTPVSDPAQHEAEQAGAPVRVQPTPSPVLRVVSAEPQGWTTPVVSEAANAPTELIAEVAPAVVAIVEDALAEADRDDEPQPARSVRTRSVRATVRFGVVGALAAATVAVPVARGAITGPDMFAGGPSVAESSLPGTVSALTERPISVLPPTSLVSDGSASTMVLRDQSVSRDLVREAIPGCDPAQRAGSANGLLATKDLCTLWDGRTRLRADAASALTELNNMYVARYGADMCIESGYRSLAQQRAVKATRGGLAATPGKSNHGWGLAIDFCKSMTWGARWSWLLQNGPVFGFENPEWAQPGGSGPQERWHWEYIPGVKADGEYYGD